MLVIDLNAKNLNLQLAGSSDAYGCMAYIKSTLSLWQLGPWLHALLFASL